MRVKVLENIIEIIIIGNIFLKFYKIIFFSKLNLQIK